MQGASALELKIMLSITKLFHWMSAYNNVTNTSNATSTVFNDHVQLYSAQLTGCLALM
jgi:hypothetical protein